MKQLFIEDSTMIEQLRDKWKHTIDHDGGKCPICDRWGKVYKRNINSTMAKSLIWLCGASNGDWVDVPKVAPRWLVSSNQLPTLKWWGLIDRKEQLDDTKKFSGFWKPTALGIDFVYNAKEIPKSVFTYNNNVEGFSSELVNIRDCFDEHFNYSDVLSTSFESLK